MTRRLALIPAALVTTLAIVLAACSSAPPALPALTDPKEILTESVLSLKDVKTVEITGSLTGTLDVAELGGSLDLSSTKISAAIDVQGQKLKASIDAPSLMGTKLEAIIVDGFAYYKIDGLLGGMAGGTPGKYTKEAVPESSDKPVTDPVELAKQIDEFKAALDKLPNAPTKGADEKCGDQDCYHVTIAASAADLKSLDPTGGAVDGDISIDVWTRKNDRRPAKISFSVASTEMGTIGMTFDFKYDVDVSVSAPAAEDVAP